MSRLYAIISAVFVIGLSGCGSSGGGSNNGSTVNNTNTSNDSLSNFTIVKAFGDGGGVATGIRSDGSRSVVIAPEIVSIVESANNTNEDDLDDITVSDLSVVQTFQSNANLRSGAITIDGIVFNVTIIEDLGGNSELFFQEIPNIGNFLFTNGTPLGSVPIGMFNYNGTFAAGLRSIDPLIEYGNFTMSADFVNATFSFNGSTALDNLSGNGFININNGSISSNNMIFTTGSTSREASIYGNFHGSTAQGVSGIFHTNELDPSFAGGFVGSR